MINSELRGWGSQEAVRVIKTGEAVDPNTPVSKVEVKDGIIFCDFSMTVEASDEQDAIAQAKQYLDKQIADASEVTPWRIYGFKAKEVA
ncbi:MAG: hypothetical protein UY15_C0021G0006 [Parcubacteria group bacterium GW2011_GWA2_47_9]|nr:MAG: hypothetical protein UY15_C0021G0006 [Parcubacteria group bacterium GW2011_GWA2_47_9]